MSDESIIKTPDSFFDKTEDLKPFLYNDHEKPVTRRDFLAQGFISGSVGLMMPTFMGWLSKNAHAQVNLINCANNTPPANNGVPIICLDLAGGGHFAGNEIAPLIDEQPGNVPTDMTRMLVTAAQHPNASVFVTFGGNTTPIQLSGPQIMFDEIKTQLNGTAIEAKSSAYAVAGRSRDDSGANEMAIGYLLAAALKTSDHQFNFTGTETGAGGGRHTPIPGTVDANLAPTVLRNGNQLAS